MNKLFILLAFIAVTPTLAQNDSASAPKKIKPYVVRGRTIDGFSFEGFASAFDDSTLFILNSSKKSSLSSLQRLRTAIPAARIQSFTATRKNRGLKGALIGVGIGVVAGVIMGYAEGDDQWTNYTNASNDPYGLNALADVLNNAFNMTAGEKAAMYGTTLGIAGAITGAIIGALAKKRYKIGGKKEKFRDLQGELMRRLVIR